MKSLRISALVLAVAATAAAFAVASPAFTEIIDIRSPLSIDLVSLLPVLALAAVFTVHQALIGGLGRPVKALLAGLRDGFPPPQTGTPQVTAFG